MNYLAHFFLSDNNDGLIVGNFIADFVKGNKYLEYDEEVRNGILLHREIDNFTDSHPTVLTTKRRLYDDYHKYAAVIVDIYYDHVLAANWEKYSEKDLKSFTTEVYEVLKAHRNIMPDNALHTLKYMVRYNWLYNYASMWGTERTLFGLSRRTSFKSNMERSIKDLKKDYSDITAEFTEFFSDIRNHLKDFETT